LHTSTLHNTTQICSYDQTSKIINTFEKHSCLSFTLNLILFSVTKTSGFLNKGLPNYELHYFFLSVVEAM
jgi:hypothetical protein